MIFEIYNNKINVFFYYYQKILQILNKKKIIRINIKKLFK